MEREDGDPSSLLNWYRRLIRLRCGNPALAVGELIPVTGVPKAVFSCLRRYGDRAVAVFLNFSSRPLAFRLPGEVHSRGTAWRTLLSTRREEGELLRPVSCLEPAAHEALLIQPD
ncbi:MAG: DUF3459 domain-containing protein [Actinobacteria bacterium]|nr:DUF3459 domain-containing protein [Actinomycetota bacterium]